MKTVAIVQARMGSTRFPRKVMAEVDGVPLIGVLIERLSRAETVDEIVLATSVDPRNDPLEAYVRGLGVAVYRGSEGDVLDRYYHAAVEASADVVVRITGDCPLVDPAVVDDVVGQFHAAGVDYLSNTIVPTYPDGLDTEVCSMAALTRAWREADAPFDREHVTPYLKTSPSVRQVNVVAPGGEDHSAKRWTVDEPSDFTVVSRIFSHFGTRRDFGWRDVLALYDSHPDLFMDNQHIARDEGAHMGTGQKLWKRAKRVIPGGNMFLSKRAEMWLPDQWPAYFSRARGCTVWDLDGRELIDMSIMGIGTNTLGYGHPDVDAAVQATVSAGNMSTLNCPEEVYLAEHLIELHPWADMARLARTGGEIDAVAVRIARAASGRDQVAICGYHGWHDWYLAANLGDEQNLAGHLLPGLEPNGVPGHLRGSVFPFRYNRIDELEALNANHDIGVIQMEVSRNVRPEDDFLQKVRALASEHGIVLIFDECTSGFREAFGGLHKVYGVEPDIATFAKALGNGYAITAAIGRREVMEAAQTTFISSTYWSERIGPSAALKTLEVMERERSWERITAIGRDIGDRWVELATRHGLEIAVGGLPAMNGYSFPYADMLKYKTLITQEMLKRGFLATTGVYTCLDHTPEVVDRYFDALDPVFGMIKQAESGQVNVEDLLEGPVCHAGFRRLN